MATRALPKARNSTLPAPGTSLGYLPQPHTHAPPEPSGTTEHGAETARPATAAPAGHSLDRLRLTPESSRPAAIQAKAAPGPALPNPAPRTSAQGKPLPEGLRGKMERSFGHDFSRVRIHEGREAEGLGAVAYTRGTDLHFAPGKFSPESAEGQKLVGHELAHVVQQQAGQVAVPQGKGAPINADPGLESQADRQGELAAKGMPATRQAASQGSAQATMGASAPLQAAGAAGPGAIQRSKSNSQKGFERNQAIKKAKERKKKTGRFRQGNHDSLTKSNKKGPKGDKHAKGVRQSGSAGGKKKKGN